jgi:tetratricopeptide (TPR) repeat protein
MRRPALQDYRSSIDQFEKAIEVDPKNVAAFVSLGTSQAIQKNNAEAEAAFQKAREINPKDKNVLMSMGNFYARSAKKTKQKRYSRKPSPFIRRTRISTSRSLSTTIFRAAWIEVEKILKGVQDANKSDPSPSIMLADIYTSVNRPGDARTLLFELKKPLSEGSQYQCQDCIAFTGNRTRSGHGPKSTSFSRPTRTVQWVFFFSGNSSTTLANTTSPLASLEKVPQVVASYPQASFILGEISLKKGDLDHAQAHFQKAIDLSGNYLPAKVGLAEVYLDKSRLGDSREEVNKILKVQPGFVPALLLKANIDVVEKKYATRTRDMRIC